MSDDLIQAALKECGLDFTDLADDKNMANFNVANNLTDSNQLSSTKIVSESKPLKVLQGNKVICTKSLEPKHATTKLPLIQKNKNPSIIIAESNKSHVIVPQKSSQPDLETKTPTIILQKSQAQPSSQIKNFKNIKIINIQRSNSPVIIKPKIASTDPDKKVVKVIFKATTNQVPSSLSAKVPSSTLQSTPVSHVITFNRNTPKSVPLTNGYLSSSLQTNLLLSKPSPSAIQLTTKSLSPKLKSESVFQKSTVNLSRAPSITLLDSSISNIPTTCLSPSPSSIIKTSTTPSSNTQNIVFSKTPVVLSSNHINLLSPDVTLIPISTLSSSSSISSSGITITTVHNTTTTLSNTTTCSTNITSTVNNNTSLSNSIKETPLRSTNSPVVKFHIGAFDDDDVDNDATKNNNTDNNKEAQSIKVKDEDEGEGEEGKMRGSGGKDEEACSFFEALQELNEANKKVAETEARLKEEEEEEERTKRIKQLLGQEELSKTPCDTTTPCNDDDSSIEKIFVDDDDDDDSVNYNNISLSNNNTNNLSTESLNKNPIEPTNILEFGRSFNKRYLPQHSSNKYNNILYNNHNSTSNVSSSGGISLLKNAFSFNPNRSYSILRPGDVVSNNFHPLVLNKESLEDELEEEEMGHAETFAAYMPTKLKIGLQHPDAVVESASLSSVEVPDIEYQTSIPSECADQGLLSAVQLETITYACQKHENELPNGDRVGFLIGDGAGVGKGRTIAGIIYENFLRGRRRSLWLSVSSDLKVDAERDLRDIGASSIPVYSLNKFKYTKISSKINGKVKKGVIFSTYSALIGESKANNKYRTRLKQLTHWLGKEFDGLIIFDECHRAKNLFPNGSSKPTKTGRTVVELQRRLPKSRVVYASATGASEPRNMAYMVRLGLWGPGTPFKEFGDFIHAVEKRGVGTMEMVAMEMKQRGTYIARQLSFKGVSFRVEEVAIAQEYADMYNDAVKLWVEARDLFQQATKLLQLDKHHTKVVWSQFWSSHQRFFKYLCISGKVEHCVQLALKAIADGKCVVIGLQSTGESRILDVVEEQGDELTDFVSSAKGVFQKLVETHFPGGNGTSDTTYQAPTPLPPNNKRKISPDSKPAKKRFKKSDSSSDDDSDKSDADNSEGSEDSSGDDDDNDDDDDDADDNSSSESESDTNPFASGSDSDCDVPWIRKKKPKAEKKEKKKKSKKERGKKGDDDEDSDCEYDRDVSRILEALKKKETMEENLKANKTSSSSLKSLTTTSATMGDLNGGDVETVANMKRDLLHKIEELGQILPPNTLDQLIDLFGGPAKVAEMTGRKGRVVCGQDGSIRYERRSVHDVSLEMLNLTEKQRFMDGEKNVAIISEAASSGISLQADRRAINQRRRVHITLELPWSADRAIQQFGRTHRSNQVSAPEYIFLISDLAGEKRFASTVSKRLESLGALTHGDRRAAEARDLSQFNIDNKFGQSALEAVMKSVIGDKPLVTPPVNNTQQFFRDARESLVGVGMVYHNKFSYSLDKESYNISKFLNRILGIEVRTQNHLFNYFSATLKHVMLEAKKNGKWDMGILDLGSLGEKVMKLVSQDFYGSFSGSKTKITLNKVSVERGLSWKDAEKIHNNLDGSDEGFYVSKQSYVKDRKMYILAQATKKHKEIFYKIFRANTGLQTKLWGLNELRLKYRRVTDEAEVRRAWQEQFTLSENQCLHMYQYAKCHNASACEIGRRCRIYHILSGSVLSFWTSVERVLSSFSGQSSKMQVVRARMKDDKRIVGILINSNAISPLIQLLRTGHLEDLPATPPHFQLPQAQQAIRQQKVVSPMYLQQQQQQQKLLQQQKLKQQQQQFQQQQQQNSKPNFVNYSHISSFQKTKVQSQQQLQHQLLQQQQRLQNFHNSYNIPSKPRFANSLSSSSLQQLNNNYNSNTLNNNNNIHKNNHENNINTNNISIKCVDSSSYTIKNNLTILPNSHHYSITNGNQQKITTINNKNNNNDFVVINHLQNNNINNNINKSIVIKTSPVLHNKMPSFTIVPAASLNKPP